MLEQPLWYVIEGKGSESDWEIDTRKAIVRAKHSRAKEQKQSLEDFDEAQWDLMNNLVLVEVERWGSKDVDFTIEISGYSTVKKAKTTSNIAPATSISTPTASLTRTDRLLDQQEARREQARLLVTMISTLWSDGNVITLTAVPKMAGALSIIGINTTILLLLSRDSGRKLSHLGSLVLP